MLLTIESVKSAEDVYSPVNGKVIEINMELEKSPELVNEDPYKNWIVKIKLDDEKYNFLTAEEYKNI